LLVSFDYGGTLIKELIFIKTTGQLLHQLASDQDPLGRIWALQQLATRINDDKTTAADRQSIIKSIGDAATKDKFWGARLEAVSSLTGVKEARDPLLSATKDTNARVRAHAVSALAVANDPSLANVYLQLLSDQSYAVIRAAAPALGSTKSPAAYDALVKLIDSPSWRDTIRGSALSGLEALEDKRALELGFKYSAAGNPNGVRAAALGLLGAVGKNDPRTLPLLKATLDEGFERRNFALMFGAADALVSLGDEKGLVILQELSKKAAASPQIVSGLAAFEARLRAKLNPAKSNP
jgi:HEAT repeat protein